MMTCGIEKMPLISSEIGIWMCESPILIHTQILLLKFSQCPLSKHVFPFCENFKISIDYSSKIGTPNPIINPYQTPLFKWFMARCGSKNIYQKNCV